MSLVFRDSQGERFLRQQEEELARKIRDDLKQHHPHTIEGVSPAELAWRIRNGMDRAKKHGFTKKYAIALFVELMFLCSPNFDEYPPVVAMLKRGDVEPDERIDLIAGEMTEDQWQGARRRYRHSAWGGQ
jgi:hypothetical protein